MGRKKGTKIGLPPASEAVEQLRSEWLTEVGIDEEDTLAPPADETRVMGVRLRQSDRAVLEAAAQAMGFRGPGDLARACLVSWVSSGKLPGPRELADRQRQLTKQARA